MLIMLVDHDHVDADPDANTIRQWQVALIMIGQVTMAETGDECEHTCGRMDVWIISSYTVVD